MLPAHYNLPTGYRGDTYGPILFYFNDISGNAVNIDGAEGASQVRDKRTKCVVLEWLTSDGSMEISGNCAIFNAVSGDLMSMPPKIYDYDFQLNSSGIKRTYTSGEFPLIQQITEV